MKLECATDGSCLNNGKVICVGGWSACFFMNGKNYVRYGHLPSQSSNNKAELTGIIYILKTFHKQKDWKIEILSDSQYCVKGINEWRRGWENRGYEDVANQELWIPLFELLDTHGNTDVKWVKGHNKHQKNELADLWAGKGMRNLKEDLTTDTLDVKMVNDFKY